jgi:hypothetical protein
MSLSVKSIASCGCYLLAGIFQIQVQLAMLNKQRSSHRRNSTEKDERIGITYPRDAQILNARNLMPCTPEKLTSTQPASKCSISSSQG